LRERNCGRERDDGKGTNRWYRRGDGAKKAKGGEREKRVMVCP